MLTAPPERLVVMLYDGALRFLARAAIAMRDQGPLPAAKEIRRTQAILEELLSTLDHEQGGEVAERLQAIYVFCLRMLAEAHVQRDAEKLDQVAGLLRELRDAWAQVCGS